MVEIVALGHHFVLAPGAIGLVLLLEIRLREPDRFRAARCNENLSPHRHFGGKWFAVFVERALVDIHLPFDGGQRVVWIDVPAIAKPSGTSDRDIGVGTDPNGRRWLLKRLDG